MPVGGQRLTLEEALALSYRAGFYRERLVTVVALMCAESGRYTGAYNINVTFTRDGNGNLVLDEEGNPVIAKRSIDRGLMQINDQHASLDMTEAFKPWNNMRFALKLSDGGKDFTPWMAFVNKAHEKFVPEVTAAWRSASWRDLVPTIREDLE